MLNNIFFIIGSILVIYIARRIGINTGKRQGINEIVNHFIQSDIVSFETIDNDKGYIVAYDKNKPKIKDYLDFSGYKL